VQVKDKKDIPDSTKPSPTKYIQEPINSTKSELKAIDESIYSYIYIPPSYFNFFIID
jgi:hypothetical protein